MNILRSCLFISTRSSRDVSRLVQYCNEVRAVGVLAAAETSTTRKLFRLGAGRRH